MVGTIDGFLFSVMVGTIDGLLFSVMVGTIDGLLFSVMIGFTIDGLFFCDGRKTIYCSYHHRKTNHLL
jgi:hypothetical protein